MFLTIYICTSNLLLLLMTFFLCIVGVWQRNFEPAVCVPGTTSRELVPRFLIVF